MIIRELNHTEMPDILFPFIQLLNKNATRNEFSANLARMLPLGYRAAGIFRDNECLAISGFWIGCKFWCGRYLEIDNFVVSESARGKSIGKQLLSWLEELAKREGVSVSMLDAYVTNPNAHRFYFREGYSIPGYHFFKQLD